MIQIFLTEDGMIHQKDELQNGAWMALTDPTATEILEISEAYGKEQHCNRFAVIGYQSVKHPTVLLF